MSQDASIAGAIEAVVIEQIYEHIERMFRFDGKADGPWLICVVVEHFRTKTWPCNITPGYVSGLIWMLVDEGKLSVDKHGMVRVAAIAV